MCRLLEDAALEMMTPGILNVSVNAGFTDADVWAAGPSVLVNYDAKIVSAVTAQATADRICARIWDFRDDWARPIPLWECIARLKAHKSTDKPVVVADFSDNPGSGGYGDSTTLLSALLDAGLGNIALGVLYDPEAADLLASAGVDAECTVLLGGKTDPSMAQASSQPSFFSCWSTAGAGRRWEKPPTRRGGLTSVGYPARQRSF